MFSAHFYGYSKPKRPRKKTDKSVINFGLKFSESEIDIFGVY